MLRIAALGVLLTISLPAADIRIRTDRTLEPAAQHGIDELKAALREAGNTEGKGRRIEILAGVASGGPAAEALKSAGIPLPSHPESLVIRRLPNRLVICGADARGLMYAAVDVADRIRWSAASRDPFEFVQDVTESPFLAERGISMYTMQRAYFESRLYDAKHWERYFDLLAASRINMFTVIFGYENGGFLAPVYPYFFDTPGFGGVKMVGLRGDQQEKNTAAFRALIRSAHARGIGVTAAIWDHIYRGGVQGGGIPGASEQAGREVEGLVTGVTAANLSEYTKASLKRFMQVFPEIDALEFRMHNESGLKREEMGAFWHDVFALLKEANPRIRVTLRSKEVPDSIIDDAIAQRLNMRMETKYWMEQMGMPFHPTHINVENQSERRHGYADLLRYPQRYRVLWRLWSGGTTRMLSWADREYARRYVESARLYDGDSIDVNEMLATRMLGEPHNQPPTPLLNANYRSGTYEFERYWPFYRTWGRIAYNPKTEAAVWTKEFERRYGAGGGELMSALEVASRVLPRIVGAAYRYQMFPTTRGWAEMMRQDDLPRFAALEGSDIEQFLSPRQEAQLLLEKKSTTKRRPEETALWFAQTAGDLGERIRKIESAGRPLTIEARVLLTDLKILAGLASYYAARLPAAVDYNLYTISRNPSALDRAIEGERRALAAWNGIVESAGDVYSKDLAFGVHAAGFPRHWTEELARLRTGLDKLAAERKSLAGSSAGPLPDLFRGNLEPPPLTFGASGAAAQPGRPYRIRVRAQDARSVVLRYRHLTQIEDYRSAVMTRDPGGEYVAEIPGDFITRAWDLIYFVEATGTNGAGRNYPDLEHGPPYIIVPVDRR